jgi:hypothetical protein
MIDEFDGEVVRFNEFVLEPVEYTGTRTDVWIIARKSHAIADLHPTLVNKVVKVPAHIQYEGKEERFRSTGVAAMYWYLERGYEVVLHGFDHFDPDRPRHYYEDTVKLPTEHHHDREMVMEAIANGKPVEYLDEQDTFRASA